MYLQFIFFFSFEQWKLNCLTCCKGIYERWVAGGLRWACFSLHGTVNLWRIWAWYSTIYYHVIWWMSQTLVYEDNNIKVFGVWSSIRDICVMPVDPLPACPKFGTVPSLLEIQKIYLSLFVLWRWGGGGGCTPHLTGPTGTGNRHDSHWKGVHEQNKKIGSNRNRICFTFFRFIFETNENLVSVCFKMNQIKPKMNIETTKTNRFASKWTKTNQNCRSQQSKQTYGF